MEAQISIGSYTPGRNTYGWGGNSGMDLAVDEQGLWVLFGSTGNSYRLYAHKIDVYKNTVTHTWSLNTGKLKNYFNFRNTGIETEINLQLMGNCFIVERSFPSVFLQTGEKEKKKRFLRNFINFFFTQKTLPRQKLFLHSVTFSISHFFFFI